jgi:multiple sugar transport system permease protein
VAISHTKQVNVVPAEYRYANWQRKYAPYFFIAPFFILYVIFSFFPNIFSFYLSLTRWNPLDGLNGIKFVGLDNYRYLVQDDTFFQTSLVNSAILGILGGIPQHLVALPLAYLFNNSLKRIKGFLSALYFAPFITSIAAISVVFGLLFSERSGLFNWALLQLHQLPIIGGLFPGEGINWLGRSFWIKPSIALVIFWRYTGWNTILYLAAMQAIPGELFEAAAIDGANRWQQFRFITLPLVRPMAFYAVTLTIIGSMQLFLEPFTLVGPDGGAGNAGRTTMMYLFKTAFTDLDFGLAAAISWVLFAIIIVMTIINNKVFNGGKAD